MVHFQKKKQKLILILDKKKRHNFKWRVISKKKNKYENFKTKFSFYCYLNFI